MAAAVPHQPAVIVTRRRDATGRAEYDSLTFAGLEARSNSYARGLGEAGLQRGMRVLLMVRPGFEFIGLVFALFKLGAAPVLIDPGMGVARLLDCIRGVDVQAFIGIPAAQVLRVLRPAAFRGVRIVITVGRRWGWGGKTLEELCGGGAPGQTGRSSASPVASQAFPVAETPPHDTAAILFTSGSTGPAKGVVYEHGMFDAQVRMIQSHYDIRPGEVDLPAFPLFALFSTAMGMTCVIPEMDPSHPARVDPAKIVAAIRDHRVTNTFGSPAIWKRVAPYCLERGISLPTLRRVLIAGAAVPWQVIEQLRAVLAPGADVHTPYGATEALPLCSISGGELFAPGGAAHVPDAGLDGSCSAAARKGAGTCVGRPLPGVEVRVIRISDAPITQWSDDLLVPDGTIGELVAGGPIVTRQYHGQPGATAAAKIADGDTIWHRMGDVGYRDAAGRLWFCGRKAQRLTSTEGTLFADQCEAVFNEHPEVARSALVGVGPPGAQQPVIIIEPKPGCFPRGGRRARFREEIHTLARANPLTVSITQVLFRGSFPVDVRHNVKINREELARWAARRVR
ncbi:MAG: AMP-binding protein [Planctomycetes bacterium]|nr:AMP-binding protein [Planctomycetota bacterium]